MILDADDVLILGSILHYQGFAISSFLRKSIISYKFN